MVWERWGPRALKSSKFVGDVERFMDDVLAELPVRVTWRRPPVDMYEREDSFVVWAEVPGVDKESIDISMSGETLTIKGERKMPEEVSDEQYHVSELQYGGFSRSITMPVAVDADAVEATHHNGVLEIRVPKAKAARATRIHVKGRDVQA